MGALTARTVLAHGVWVDDHGMEIIARHNCVVVRNAGCNLRLRNGIAPVARYLRHGVRLAIGTDNNALADDEDLLKELRLTGILARVPEWDGDEPPAAVDLLSMATVNGAAAAQLDDRTGILEPGAKADLIAISMDRVVQPYLDADMPVAEAMLARAEGSDVRLTMVDGRIVYRDGSLSFVDANQAAEHAARAAFAARLPGDPRNRERAREFAPLLIDHYRSMEREPGQ
jgi:cytosine/adenosine deaminase-related metal-dependent hydrolase